MFGVLLDQTISKASAGQSGDRGTRVAKALTSEARTSRTPYGSFVVGSTSASRRTTRGQPPFPGPGLRVLPDELKVAIVLFYSLLDERQRRLYAGLEAMKVGHGGTPRSPSCSTSTLAPSPGAAKSCSPATFTRGGCAARAGAAVGKKSVPEVIEAIGPA